MKLFAPRQRRLTRQECSGRAHSVLRPAFGGAMLTLLRVRRAGAPSAPAGARRRFPPASKSGLLAAFIFLWQALLAVATIETNVARAHMDRSGAGRNLQTTNLGVRSSNLFGRAS
jgi:hypothetical protein